MRSEAMSSRLVRLEGEGREQKKKGHFLFASLAEAACLMPVPGKERLAAHALLTMCLRVEKNRKGSRLRLGAQKIC